MFTLSDIYTGIDLGTNSIKVVVCEKLNDNYHVLASSNVPSNGIKNGYITDTKLAINSVSKAIKQVNEMLGIKIAKVIACVPPTDCKMNIAIGSTSVIDYNDISLANIYNLANQEKAFVTNLGIMNDSGFFDDLEDDENPYELYLTGEYIREELSNAESLEEGLTYDEYLATRKQYFAAARAFLTKETEDYFCTVWEDDADYIHDLFTETNKAFDSFMKFYETCKKVENAICIIGTNASSTTDYGINQYEEHYPNPGVHYAFANMILSQDFVDDAPAFISVIIAMIVCLCYGFISSKIKKTGPQIIFGIAAVVVTAGCHLLYFIITKQYVGAVVPVVSVFVSSSSTFSLFVSSASNFLFNKFS